MMTDPEKQSIILHVDSIRGFSISEKSPETSEPRRCQPHPCFLRGVPDDFITRDYTPTYWCCRRKHKPISGLHSEALHLVRSHSSPCISDGLGKGGSDYTTTAGMMRRTDVIVNVS